MFELCLQSFMYMKVKWVIKKLHDCIKYTICEIVSHPFTLENFTSQWDGYSKLNNIPLLQNILS